jgi:hypothetical protein
MAEAVLRPICLLLLLCACTPALAANFNGSWTGYVCPKPGMNDRARCSSFSIRLFERNGRVCGSHVFATAGAREMDEGGTPSLLATHDGDNVNGTVESARSSPPVRLAFTLAAADQELRWQLTNNPPGDYLLPRSMTMRRTRGSGLLSPLFEQRLSAACSAYLDMPNDKEKTGPKPP